MRNPGVKLFCAVSCSPPEPGTTYLRTQSEWIEIKFNLYVVVCVVLGARRDSCSCSIITMAKWPLCLEIVNREHIVLVFREADVDI